MKLLIFLCAFPLLAMLKPGITTIEQFRKLRPGVVPEVIEFNETITRKAILENLFDGNWQYRFQKSKLKEVHFTGSIIPLKIRDSSPYNKKLETENVSRAKKVVKQLSQTFGNPVKELELSFKAAKNYTALETIWHHNGMEITLKLNVHHQPVMQQINNAPLFFPYLQLTIHHTPLKNKNIKQTKLYLNMGIKNFMKSFPEININTRPSGQWGKKERFWGLDGTWHYNFKEGILNSYHFSFYINDGPELNGKNFKSLLASTKKIIKYYRKKFGKPKVLKRGKQHFIDPYKKRHWGYDVLEAKWIKKDQKIKVEFDFFGGKGTYFFLVKINFFPATYPYFD